jgi:hypothetical protein
MMKRLYLAGMVVACLAASLDVAFTATPTPPPIEPLYGDHVPFSDTTYGSPQTGFYRYGTSAGPIVVTGAKLIGPNAASFSIIGNTCTGGIVLQGATTCEVDLKFSPQASGYLDESIELSTNLGTYDQDIAANGVAAAVLVSPTKIDFGFQAVGTSVTRNITLTNPNPFSVNFDFTYYQPQADESFLLSTVNCGPLAGGASCTYQLQFVPQNSGIDAGNWPVSTFFDANGEHSTTGVSFSGTGFANGVAAADLSKSFNVAGIDTDSAHVLAGGLDQLGNVFASELLPNPLFAAGQLFNLSAPHTLDAVSGTTIALSPGNYYGITLLGTAVRGNQVNQPFVVTYSDGSSLIEVQSMSDWHTPQHYPGESVALSTPYRLTTDGVRTNGPFSLYTYTLPVSHSKSVVSVKLPPSRSVAVFAINLNSIGVPLAVDLTPQYNVHAYAEPRTVPATDGGIDGLNDWIDWNAILNSGVDLGALGSAPDYKANAVANVTLPLPDGIFSSVRLLGTAVRGNYANQTVIVKYKDGTTSVLHQGFSDWHTWQKYPGESVALAMTDRLTSSGGAQAGMYNIYQYDLSIDPGKQVEALVLPPTRNVVILQVTLEP